MYGSLLTHYDPADSSSERLQWGFLPFLLWLPYFQVFWRLRDIGDSERVKKALAQSVAWGFFGALWALAGAAALWSEKNWTTAVIVSTLAIFLVLLLGSAIKGYYSMERRRGDVLILAARSRSYFSLLCLSRSSFRILLSSTWKITRQLRQTPCAPLTKHKLNTPRLIRAKALPRPLKSWASSWRRADRRRPREQPEIQLHHHIEPRTFGHEWTHAQIHPHRRAAILWDFDRRHFFADEYGVIRYTAENRAHAPRSCAPVVLDREVKGPLILAANRTWILFATLSPPEQSSRLSGIAFAMQ